MNPISHTKSAFQLLLLVCLLSACSSSSGSDEIRTITAATLLSQPINQRGLIIDVRTAEEYSAGHVPGAINIPHTSISQQLGQLDIYKNKTVVIYCKSGRRAGIAGEILAGAGFKQLYHLEGDMDGWRSADHPVEK